MRTAIIAALLAAVAATPAVALSSAGSDCETSPDGCGAPPGPPPVPTLPPTTQKSGTYRVYSDPYGDTEEGYVRGDSWTYFGGGAFRPIGGDGTLTRGFAGSSATLRGTLMPEATSRVSASAYTNYSASASLATSYIVELHASSATAFAALLPYLSTSGAIAKISGSYALATTGQAYAIASASTGNNGYLFPLPPALNKTWGLICDRSGYFDSTGAGCGSGTYTLDLNFAAGTLFADGNRHSIYGAVVLGSDVHAGATGISGIDGTASAFVDPTITLNPLFNSPLYTLNVGSSIVPGNGGGAVPEPAAWTLLLAGFAAVGGAARRTRTRVVAA
ncbi:MAG: PEPxxWA-CTERM sorting domain-containing protein [Sphingomonadaceae bacterium]|nr:PEPxxWA-CTERM sorting domain-containing protein [Sphingomonadaceae bacterium]